MNSKLQKGATIVEYAVLVALIAIVSIVAIRAVGTKISTNFSESAERLN